MSCVHEQVARRIASDRFIEGNEMGVGDDELMMNSLFHDDTETNMDEGMICGLGIM
ncbi:MAG: hypothetical protein K5989_12410 [Lachnospiraceae bacterium]|nr:hypothetical protein [Lachnospiraceae bacterium]